MKDVYLLSNSLRLYEDSGYFFASLQRPRILTKADLYAAFPKGSSIRVYLTREAAEQAVRSKRSMRIVEDEDRLKGYSYHSRVTPVIFKVKLRKDADERHFMPTVHFDAIDKKFPAEVICLEKKFDALIPKEISLKVKRFPPSYDKIFSRGDGDLVSTLKPPKHSGLISIFGDYCGHQIYHSKGFEKIDLFLHGHWNRHHVKTVQTIMNKYDPDGLKEGNDIIGFLNDLKLELLAA